jgi:hypothetical protein
MAAVAGLYFKRPKGEASLVKKETWSLAFFWLGGGHDYGPGLFCAD